MVKIQSSPNEPSPQHYRDGLAELFQMGLTVARMVTRVAEAEIAVADAAAEVRAAEGASPMPTSLAEAIEADRAFAAAAEARHTVVARADVVTRAFARIARCIRLTVAQAERLDRGWARPTRSDDRRAMARRQVARAVADVIAREAEGERAERLTESLTERLESPDWEDEFEDLPVEEVITRICRDLGLDPVRGTVNPRCRASSARRTWRKRVYAPAAGRLGLRSRRSEGRMGEAGPPSRPSPRGLPDSHILSLSRECKAFCQLRQSVAIRLAWFWVRAACNNSSSHRAVL